MKIDRASGESENLDCTPPWSADLRDYLEQWREAAEQKRWVEEQLTALIPHEIAEIADGDVRIKRRDGSLEIDFQQH